MLKIKCKKPPHSTESGVIQQALENICETKKLKNPKKSFAYKSLNILIQAEKQAHRQIDEDLKHKKSNPTHLHEAQDIVIDIAGAAWGLANLGISLNNVICFTPVHIGGGFI